MPAPTDRRPSSGSQESLIRGAAPFRLVDRLTNKGKAAVHALSRTFSGAQTVTGLARHTLFVATLVGLAACSGNDSQPATPATESEAGAAGNVFRNPSFEDGEASWISLTSQAWGPPFTASREVAHSGQQSAYLELRGTPGLKDVEVVGVVQEIAPEQFPEFLSGYYRVEDWKRGTAKQYLQFVVIVFGADGSSGGFPNNQIRYPLAGISEEPFDIANAKFVFVGTDEPATNTWVYFERNIRQDFLEQWGAVPEHFDKLRILFEVRYDDYEPLDDELEADVFYDDLYIGPAPTAADEP